VYVFWPVGRVVWLCEWRREAPGRDFLSLLLFFTYREALARCADEYIISRCFPGRDEARSAVMREKLSRGGIVVVRVSTVAVVVDVSRVQSGLGVGMKGSTVMRWYGELEGLRQALAMIAIVAVVALFVVAILI
jgi:hypothetical protein